MLFIGVRRGKPVIVPRAVMQRNRAATIPSSLIHGLRAITAVDTRYERDLPCRATCAHS